MGPGARGMCVLLRSPLRAARRDRLCPRNPVRASSWSHKGVAAVLVPWSFRSCCLQANAASSAGGSGSSGSFGRDNGSGTVPVEADMVVVRERLDAVVFSCRSVSVLAPLRMSEAAL